MEPLLLRGQLITEKDLGIIRSAIEDNPSASRTAISKRLCALLGWYSPNGQPKDCACREIPGSLEARGLISLPAPKVPQEQFRPKAVQPPMLDQSPMGGHLHDYGDASLELVSHAKDFRFCRYLVGTFHFLGLKRSPAGESLSYLASIGARPVACLVWASPAFSAGPLKNVGKASISSSTTPASSSCLGQRFETSPPGSALLPPSVFPRTGSSVKAIPSFSPKPSSKKTAVPAPATRPPTGPTKDLRISQPFRLGLQG